MGANSDIAWTDHTFNPWIGCAHVSPGCENCYAETLANRWRWAKWGSSSSSSRTIASESTWRQPLAWNRKAYRDGVRRRVFCASLADVFEDRPELVKPRERLFRLIGETSKLDWLLLTKRPEEESHLIPSAWHDNYPTNVCFGISADNRETLHARAEWVPRGVVDTTFLSYEPALGPIDIARYPYLLDWIIVGGESGPRARPMRLDWVRDLRRDCVEQDVPFFFKQTGTVLARSLGLRDRAGADPSEWPADLADVFVRELPERWTATITLPA